ncbi:MAG: Secretion system C-terminal sorting domain [Bacteroidota bacterium]
MNVVSNLIGNEYTYEDHGVIFLRYQNQWDTLYHFNAQVGDHWRMVKQPFTSVCPENSRLKVLATGNKTINNETRKYLVVDFCNPDLSSLGIQDTIVENIGFIGSYFLPYDQFDGTVDGNEGGPFRCYSHDNFATYAPHFSEACDYIVGLEEENSSKATFSIFPNPVRDEIQLLKEYKSTFTTYSIYSLDGKIQQAGSLSEVIQLDYLRDGNYILEISGTSKKQFAKLMKVD